MNLELMSAVRKKTALTAAYGFHRTIDFRQEKSIGGPQQQPLSGIEI